MTNKLINIGDTLTVNVNSLIKGRVRFSGFTETFNGITTDRYVTKEFRVSTDEIFWSEWEELTVENISKEDYVSDVYLFIEVRYKRVGTDASGEIEFVKIEFQGNREEIEFVAPTLSKSIFAKLIGTEELQKLEKNLFKKLYFRGVLPSYVTRAENVSYKEDKDFVDFFYSVARFFALIIRFFKRFESFRTDEELLREQIRAYGIYFDESNITIEELQYIAQNILSIIQQRGTEMIFVRKGELLPNGNNAEIDGEALRLIRSRVCDEVIYDSIPTYKMGWCLGNASPMYRGTAQAYNLNKTKEDTKDFVNLDNHYLTKREGGNYSLATLQNGNKVLRLSTTSSGKVGIGNYNFSDITEAELAKMKEELLIADSRLDYEITFSFKVNTNDGGKLIFGVEGFDINKNNFSDAFITTDGDIVTNDFWELELDKFISGIWYRARGIIHAYSSEYFESTTNLGYGKDLIFNNFFTKYMQPKIILDSAGSSTVDIWDYKVRPLVRGKNIMPLRDGKTDSFSLGFIQASPMFHTYFRNNNNSMSEDEITSIIEKYLYPFNSINLFTILSNF